MTGWNLVGLALALLFVLDGVRMRRRLSTLSVLSPGSPGAESEEFAWILASGVTLEPAERDAAVAFAIANGIEVLDLVPGRWNVADATGFLQIVDPATFRQDSLAPGYTAGCALLARRALLAKASMAESSALTALQMLQCARRLKRYAPRTSDFAVDPSLKSTGRMSTQTRHAILVQLFHHFAAPLVVAQLSLLGLSLFAAIRCWQGVAVLGWLGLAAYNAQAAITFLGTGIRAVDLPWTLLFALPRSVWDLLSGVLSSSPDPEQAARIAARRAVYRDDLARKSEEFFQPRRTDCYVCGSPRLRIAGRQPDLFQHKPGKFTLEQCVDCGHLFQNPQLNREGLAFHYRDFYDGLGEDWLESVFGLSRHSYEMRAKELTGAAPQRWLDVGGGYGHFALIAKETWPQTRFECLDVGESAIESVRRGWSDAAHTGFLPELAPSLAGQFDVVSLSHCLEHTPDPRAEIAAARQTLRPLGALLIEVPDPECLLRHVFRRFWLPYFQPQHLHLLSVKNLTRLLTEAGFSIERVTRGPAHMGADGIAAAIVLLDSCAPPADVAWRAAPSAARRYWRGAVWSLGTPLLVLGVVFDALIERLTNVPRVSNAYRVLARAPGASS